MRVRSNHRHLRTRLSLIALLSGCAMSGAREPLELWAFTAPWDPTSDAAVRAHGAELDVIVTGWIALDSATALPIHPPLFADTVRPDSGTVPRMALVTNWHVDRFHAGTIRRLASDPTLLARASREIVATADSAGYEGLVLDFETLTRGDLEALLLVARSIADSARARALQPIVIAVPALDTAAYPARRLLDVADLLLVMLYDQHWMGSAPGPISAPDWVASALELRLGEVGPRRLVAGLPTYGYRWRRGAATEIIGLANADSIARAEGVSLERDSATSTLWAERVGEWELWVTDAELLRRLVEVARVAGVHRVALWRLGQEDPAIWRGALR
jgi:spore germination protein YaaH